MARFHGKVGYGEAVEEPSGSGVYKDRVIERSYFGDVIRNSRKLDSGDTVNNDISVDNSISIIADAYAYAHFMKIKYVEWAGVFWTVTNITVQRPRLTLNLGSVYNGPTP